MFEEAKLRIEAAASRGAITGAEKHTLLEILQNVRMGRETRRSKIDFTRIATLCGIVFVEGSGGAIKSVQIIKDHTVCELRTPFINTPDREAAAAIVAAFFGGTESAAVCKLNSRADSPTLLQISISNLLNGLSHSNRMSPTIVNNIITLFGSDNIVGVENFAVLVEIVSRQPAQAIHEETYNSLEKYGIFRRGKGFSLVPDNEIYQEKLRKYCANFEPEIRAKIAEIYRRIIGVDLTMNEIQQGMQEVYNITRDKTRYNNFALVFPFNGVHRHISHNARSTAYTNQKNKGALGALFETPTVAKSKLDDVVILDSHAGINEAGERVLYSVVTPTGRLLINIKPTPPLRLTSADLWRFRAFNKRRETAPLRAESAFVPHRIDSLTH